MPSRFVDRQNETERIYYLIPWAGLLLGVLLVGSAYRGASIPGAITPLWRFWLGLAFFYLPAFWRILSMGASRNERAALLAASALFSMLPRLLLCPEYFCTYEELSWWRAVQDLLAGGGLLGAHPLGVTQGAYPALPLLTAVLQNAAGLSTYHTGLILAGLFRVTALLGIFLLGERVFLSTRAGALSALIFLIYPEFFNSSGFTAERLGLTLIIAAVLAAHHAAERSPDKTPAWSLMSLGLILAISITQPAAGLVLSLILGLMAAAERWVPGSTRLIGPQRLGKIAGLSLLVSTTWLLAASPGTLSTLLGGIRRGWLDIQTFSPQALLQSAGSGPLLGFLGLLLTLSLVGIFLIHRFGLPILPAAVGLFSGGFVSLALITLLHTDTNLTAPLSGMGLFIGIPLLAGLAVAWFTAPKRAGEAGSLRIGRQILVLALLAAVLGSVVIPTTPSWRFLSIPPAENQPTFTRENVDAARWMLNQAGPGNRFLGDQTSLRVFGSLGMQDPVAEADPRAWDALKTVHTPLQTLLWLTISEAPYLVLDERTSDPLDLAVRATPTAWKEDNQPAPPAPNPRDADLDAAPMLARIYDSGQVRIYHLPIIPTPENPPSSAPEAVFPSAPAEFNQAGSVPLTLPRIWLSLLIFLLLPGYLLGAILFDNWKRMDVITRLVVSMTGSVSLTILLATLTGFVLPAAARAGEVILTATTVLALILLRGQKYSAPQRAGGALRRQNRQVHRTHFSALILAAGGAAVAMSLLSWSVPDTTPRTDFALNLTAPLSLQIANHEGQVMHYTIVARTNEARLWRSDRVKVSPGQTIEVNLAKAIVMPEDGGRLELDLLKDGQASPYRSLYLSFSTADENRYPASPRSSSDGD